MYEQLGGTTVCVSCWDQEAKVSYAYRKTDGVKLDELLTWLGAEVVDFPVKTHCCGGHLTQIGEEEAFELIRRLLYSARYYEADVVACLCPMCQLNLDAYQGRVNNHFNTEYRTPVLFLTQIVGLAFGLAPADLGFGKEIVSATPALAAAGLE